MGSETGCPAGEQAKFGPEGQQESCALTILAQLSVMKSQIRRGCCVLVCGLLVSFMIPRALRGQTDDDNWDSRFGVPGVAARSAWAFNSIEGKFFVVGEFTAIGGIEASGVAEWDGTNWMQRLPTNRPPARGLSAMTYDSARDQVILFGGLALGTSPTDLVLADTWVWDGTDWIQKSPPTSPQARYAHAMSMHTATSQVVLFGGYNLLDDTWVWGSSN